MSDANPIIFTDEQIDPEVAAVFFEAPDEDATPVAEDEDPIQALIAAQPQGEVRPEWVSQAIENRPSPEPSPGACNPGEPNTPPQGDEDEDERDGDEDDAPE